MRKVGFYWVKLDGGWEIGRYSALSRSWLVFGRNRLYSDTDLDQIGPRLEPPK